MAMTSRPPDDEPDIVMLLGLPPNDEIFSFTQSNAAAKSSIAKLPEFSSGVPFFNAGSAQNPRRPSL